MFLLAPFPLIPVPHRQQAGCGPCPDYNPSRGARQAVLPGDDDAELIRESREAGALLLTRDKGIMARKGVDALYVESDELEKQLWQVVGALGMPGGGEVMSRCSLCNTPLEEARRDDLAGAELADEVPLRILEEYGEFWYCSKCKKAYWRGSHFDRIMKTIEELERGS